MAVSPATEFDVVVIGITFSTNLDLVNVLKGGGSGGLAFAKEAAKLGANVAVLDFVKPSSQYTYYFCGPLSYYVAEARLGVLEALVSMLVASLRSLCTTLLS